MKIFLLLLAICSCLGHQCYRSVKTYIAECEIPNTLDSEYCKNKRQEAINGGCAQEIKDFDICKDDLRKLCSPDRENPKGCFGRCLMNKLPLLSSECANTETVKRILERIKSGRFPNPPVPENGGDSPNTPYPPQPNDPRPEGPPRQGGEQPPRPDGEQPPRPIGDHQPRPDGEQPQPPRSGEQPPRPNEELPAPEEQPEPSRVDPVPKVENPVDNKLGNRPGIGRGHNRHEVKHSESEAEWRNGMRGPHRWNKFHRRCGRKVILASIVASLLFTVGLCWTIRERQRRAFLRRSRVTTTKAPGSWSTGLFGSWDQIAPDWKTCLPSFLFPCFQNALNQSELQDRDCTFADFFFNIASWQRQSNTYRDRQEIRARHNIPEDSCGDCLAAVFCNPCAVAQNAREIDIRTCAQGGTYWPAQKLPDTWVPAAKADIV